MAKFSQKHAFTEPSSFAGSTHPKGHQPASGDVAVSFEFFPPKTERMEQQLWGAIQKLEPLTPRFVSVTYGAGGSTRDRTFETACRIRRETTLEPAAHLTCVDAARKEIDETARRYWEGGIRHVVAIRGDPAADAERYRPHPEGYRQAVDLVAAIKRIADFEVSVGAHPEIHPEAPSLKADLDNLKRKIDAGAARAITQFFFDVDVYLRFRDHAQAVGITAPIVAGILPINNFTQLLEFSAKCGASVPRWLRERFDGLEDDPKAHKQVAVAVLIEQCRRLLAHGAREFHFYTLNRAELTVAACHALGLHPSGPPASQASPV